MNLFRWLAKNSFKARLEYLKKRVEQNAIKRYALKFMKDPEKEKARLISKKRVMVIDKSDYQYSFFNICYLKDIASLMLYAMWKGCIPFISVNSDSGGVLWEWYFEQPYKSFFGLSLRDINGYDRKTCKKNISSFSPKASDVWDLCGDDFRVWQFICSNFAILNDSAKEYVKKDYSDFCGSFDLKKTCGVLLRGTDYTKMHPPGHPVQPEPEEIIDLLEDVLKNDKGYTGIYVATEEKRLFETIRTAFPKYTVYENKRTYIDDAFYSQNCNYISEIKDDTMKSDYDKGLEYLSSLQILSKCRGFVGAGSGGTQGCLYYKTDIANSYVINKGTY